MHGTLMLEGSTHRYMQTHTRVDLVLVCVCVHVCVCVRTYTYVSIQYMHTLVFCGLMYCIIPL